MTDEEIICEFMEPQPVERFHSGHGLEWWSPSAGYVSMGPFPVTPHKLTLDRLHEVEARLTKEQRTDYVDEMVDDEAISCPESDFSLLHATAAQKIKALATVLRQCNQTSH